MSWRSLPGLPAFLHLLYLLDKGVSYSISSLNGFWTEHASWSPSGAFFLAAEVREAVCSTHPCPDLSCCW